MPLSTDRPIDREKLRRIALTHQRLGKRRPFGLGVEATSRTISHLGYVQIDTISVVVRAHNHILRTRVPNFQNDHIESLLQARKIFEYRFPVAAFRPMQDFRFTLPHARKFRAKASSREAKAMMKRVIQRIKSEGPLRSRDFADSRKKNKGWWDWKPAKRALEQLYYQGDLMIVSRAGFEKSYDLVERVLPSSVDSREPTLEEFASFLIDTNLRVHGFASYKSFSSGGRHGIPLGSSIKAELKHRTNTGDLEEFTTDTGARYWALPETLDHLPPRPSKTVQILSPFDNLVNQRERLSEVFDFDYQIECYVPEAKRRYGYFCLPILYCDQLIGRMDCKSHRDESRLEIKALFLEPAFTSRKRLAEVIDPLSSAIADFARFDNCNDVVVTKSTPPIAKTMLRKGLSAHL
jgi:uncharacterized protein YcaQ